jgi:hypothetical protein
MKNFMDAINTNVLAPKTAVVMRSLCQLYGVHGNNLNHITLVVTGTKIVSSIQLYTYLWGFGHEI